MKGTIRIISGLMRGRVVPFNLNRFTDAEITPQKVKGAVFSILGEKLRNKTFVDLYSGSGQIGIEALSRESSLVVFNEKDRSRFEFIKDYVSKTGYSASALFLNLKADSALKVLSERGVKPDYVFIDPPYCKDGGGGDYYSDILSGLGNSGVLNEDSVIIVQHYTANELPEICGGFNRKSLKRYGTTSLSVYIPG